MPIHNSDIAVILARIADLLEIRNANPFRVRAYRNAARTVSGLPESVAEMVARGEDLDELPAIGRDLAGKIAEIVETGHLRALDELEREVPVGLVELLNLPGLGPKRVEQLHQALGIDSVKALTAAAKTGKLRTLKGFGAKTEERLLAALATHGAAPHRTKRAIATEVAEPLVRHLAGTPGVSLVTVAGSYRRKRDTVGDLDILVTGHASSPVMERFVGYEDVARVLAHGGTRSSVVLRNGLQVDLRLVADASYGSALHYFTGSKAHNIAVRKLGLARGLKINEYGIFRGARRVGGATEEEVYRAVGLPYIEPELREDRGEIEAARAGRLPRLVTLEDLRGDLHVHSKASDGHASIAEMAAAAQARGYRYMAVSDHSRSVRIAHGLDAKRLRTQIAEIDRLNARLDGITVLKSSEVDILEDGSLDLPDSILRELDFTVCAVHSHFNLSRERQTERIMRAMDNPLFTIFAHPTGRLIEARPPCELDLDRLIGAAKERGCFLEVNAQPDRLDLDDVACKMAKEMGVKLAVSTDAHGPNDFGFIQLGIDQARRGWLEPEDVINTRPLGELRKLLQRV
jgi:DNA polymerase (family X)